MKNKNENVYLGLDIGGTKLLVAAADLKGNILKELQAPTPRNFKEGIELLNNMASEVCENRKILAIGAAAGGPLDWKTGIISPLHQPEWRNVPLKEIMQKKWKCPFYVDVDTNIAAIGEYYFGENKAEWFLYMTISTGMGGGFLLNGKIYRGKDGAHPEIGHQAINFKCSHPENIHCECGAPDCIEALISGNGIRRIYGKPAEKLTEKEWDEVSYNLGQGLRNLATIYLPDLIVIGGGVACGRGEKLLAPARKILEDHIRIVPLPEVRISHLGYHTAIKGCIAVAMHGLE